MPTKFKVGDSVTWSSELGAVSSTIIKIHTKDFRFKGRTLHATIEDPQYEIKSHKSSLIAIHKGTSLSRIEDRFE